jgi:2',3'-cyclic-nucleotide 2'-phosphodiesterase (5'-nucleotidase family)
MVLLGQLGLDAMVVGNHELWFPPTTLAYAWSSAGRPFPMLSANVVPTPPLDFVLPRTMIEVGGLKVGVVGLTTPFDRPSQPNATFLGAANPPAGLIAIAAPQVAALRGAGADAVILLSHLGIQLDRLLAQYLPGLDAIVGGHDHYEIAEVVTGPGGKAVPIVHAGAYYQQIGRIQLSVGAGGVTVAACELVPVDLKVPRPTPAESPVAATVAAVQQVVAGTFANRFDPPDPFHTPIAHAEKNVSSELRMDLPKRDTGTGNLVTDALRARTGTDLAFTVTGQTPQGIAAGPVVQEDVFRMVGLGVDLGTHFGARIATARVYGWAIAKALETTVAASLKDDDYILQVSGMRYAYDSSLAAPPRVVSIEIGGQPLEPGREYTVTMNALLYTMMPTLDIPLISGELLDDFEFSAIRDFVASLGSFTYAGENRVRDLAMLGKAKKE